MKSLRKHILKKRKELGFTVQGLADKASISRSHLTNVMYFKGQLTDDQLNGLANAMNEDALYLKMLSETLTAEMKDLLFSDYETYRWLHDKSLFHK